MWEFSREFGKRVVTIEEFANRGWRAIGEEARRIVGEGPAYLSLDIDALDPAFAPGTGTSESGGMSALEAQRPLRELDGLDLVGADLVEVSCPFDPSGIRRLPPPTYCSKNSAYLHRREGEYVRLTRHA